MNTNAAFSAIARDLNITKYAEESSSSFRARVAYSAVGMWIRMFATTASESDGGLSKTMMHRKSNSIIDNFVKMDGELEKWFYPTEASNPENNMRSVFLRVGEICETGFEGRITCGPAKTVGVSSELSVLFGNVNPSDVKMVSGLSCVSLRNTSAPRPDKSLLEICDIPLVSSEDLLRRITKNAHWEKVDNLDNYEIFDPTRKKVLSSCWSNYLPLNPSQIYMARRQYSFGAFDYQLIKMEDDSIQVSSFSDYEQNEYVRETQRILYALKAIYGTPSNAVYEHDQTYAIFHFWSKLPPAEELLLRYIGWPLENIDNSKNEFMVRKEYISLVKAIAKNLNIKMEVNKHE